MLGKVRISPWAVCAIAALWLLAGAASAEAMGHDHAMHDHMQHGHMAPAAPSGGAGHVHDMDHSPAPAGATTALAREVHHVQHASSGAVCPHGKPGPCVCHLLRMSHGGCCLKRCGHAPQEPDGASLAPMIEQAVMERANAPVYFVQTAFVLDGAPAYAPRRSSPDPRPPSR